MDTITERRPLVGRMHAMMSRLLDPGEALSQRVLHAGFWVLFLRLSQQAITFGRTIVLARLLAPGDFGVMGIALLSHAMLEMASNTGFFPALVQRKGDIRGFLNTAWTIEVIRGALTGSALFLSAGYIATFFGAPHAEPIIQVVGIVFVLHGLRNIGMVYLRRELELHREFIFRFSQTLANTLVAIPLAFLLDSVWALAFGYLAEGLTGLLLSYVIHPFRPRPGLDLAKARELFRFGRWAAFTNIGLFVGTQMDRAFVGKLLGPAALGLYQVGGRTALLLASELAETIIRVSFPTYAKLQEQLHLLRQAALRTLDIGLSVTLPMSVCIAVLAPELVKLLLGDAWLGAIPAVRVLAFAAVTRFVISTGGVPFQGMGQPGITARVTMLSLTGMALLLWPLTVTYGVAGAALAVIGGNVIALPYLFWKWHTLLDVGYRQIAASLLPGAFLAGSLLVAMTALRSAMSSDGAFYLVLALLVGGVAYTAACFALWRVYRVGPFQLVHSALRRSVMA
jgi:O-antigen/teichoic acid export membrane protein